MPQGAGNKLGEAYVEIGAKLTSLTTGLARAEAMVRGTMARVGTIMAGIGEAFSLNASIKAADELDRAMRYAGMVFGESSKLIIDQAEQMSSQLGVLRTEAIRGTSEIGEVFRRAGASADLAARLANQLAKVTTTTAMIRDVDLPDALKKIEYGLEGSSRGLRSLGINIHETQVEMQAMRMGAIKLGGAFLESDLVAARATLLMRALQGSVKNLDMANLSLGTLQLVLYRH